jgi:hypothetical protein
VENQMKKSKSALDCDPLLSPYEDEEVWGVDYKENKIHSLNNNLSGAIDPMAIAMNQINTMYASLSQVNINAFH